MFKSVSTNLLPAWGNYNMVWENFTISTVPLVGMGDLVKMTDIDVGIVNTETNYIMINFWYCM